MFFSAKDENEAIAIANDSPYGLGGSIYTKDIERGKRLASKIDTGMVFINYPSLSAPDLPFGGIKRSGYGKELANLGDRGIRQQKADLRREVTLACGLMADRRDWPS